MRGGGCRGGFGGDDQKKTRFQQGATETIDLAKTAFHAVTNHRGSDLPGNNDRPPGFQAWGFQDPHAKKVSVLVTAG